MPLTGGAKDTSYATWALTSQIVWPGQGWRHHYMNSQTEIKFDDSPQIGTWGCVDSNQKVKASMRVPAPLVLGHQNITGDVSERWRSMATDAETLQNESEAMECMGMIRSSPRSCRARRRGRRWSGGGDRRRPSFGMPSPPRMIRGLLDCMARSRRMGKSRRSSRAPRRDSGWLQSTATRHGRG
jgi:hypothetical protein